METLKITYFKEANAIPKTVYTHLGCEENLYFNPLFLSAFETANPHIYYHYLFIKQHQKPVALAVIQELDVLLDNATETLPLPKRFARSLQCYLSNRKTHVLVCGNVFLSGKYGIISTTGIVSEHIYSCVVKHVKQLKTHKKAAGFFFKDFCDTDIPFVNAIKTHQFEPFAVEPNMRLKMRWSSFDAYKNDLKSKYRVKVNRADQKSKDLRVIPLDAAAVEQHLETLEQLYQNITERAGFHAVPLSLSTYVLLKKRFRESVYIYSYWHKYDLVGFTTAFFNGTTIDAHFIGIDYDQNKNLAIYPRMLNDYIRLAVRTGASELNFGRTASEIKSTLGAEPESLCCYVKHRRTAANLVFKPLIRQIKMTEYKQHTPFKKKKS